MARTLRVEPLTREAFAPFGQVIAASGAGLSANQGSATRFDWAAELASTRPEAKANVAVFRSIARTLPFQVELLEQHPCSTQMFVPMVCGRFLVCVAPTAVSGAPELGGLRAFVGQAGQGINYGVGVWHHPIVALDCDADLLMVAWEDGGARDCVERWVGEEIEIVA